MNDQTPLSFISFFAYSLSLSPLAGHMSWIMKLYIGLLLLVTFSSVLGNSSGGRKSRQNNGGTGSAPNSIYTNSNHSITIVSNETITHSAKLNVDLKHLVVDRNTGRVSFSLLNLAHKSTHLIEYWICCGLRDKKNVYQFCIISIDRSSERFITPQKNSIWSFNHTFGRLVLSLMRKFLIVGSQTENYRGTAFGSFTQP